MCGICGVIAAEDRSDPADLDRLARRMTAAMVHRGPDSDGHLVDPGIALGMRRLSIIDRATGNQPLFSDDRSVAVIFNGEIYNFQALREELQAKGRHFRTASDTEAIVHAYEEWGEACVTRLRGMFALAIYDRRARRILVARDRLGIKPLYYTRSGGRFFFASEVRALLASGAIARIVSSAGLESYLLFGSVCEPQTLIEGVRSLLPGHSLSLPVGPPVNGTSPHQYWALRPPPLDGRRTNGHSNDEPAHELRALLEDSVRLHLISDEPLGVFLSGGVDSTAIAALASKARAGVCCYTIRFREREFDESEVARRTAQRLGVEHRELLVEPDEMLGDLDAAIGALDQPSADGINTYCVSGAVRRAGAKVALSGLGGDELFGGYRTFRWMPSLDRVSSVARWTPGPVRRAGAQAIAQAGAWLGRSGETSRLASICRDPDALPHPFYFARTVFGPRDLQALMPTQTATDASPEPWRRWIDETAGAARGWEPFTAVSYLELRSYMLNTLLRDADAMSMAHSLELRVPLIDHPIVEFVSAQPDRVKQRSGTYKPLLVAALDDLLPREVFERPKQGFMFPWPQWLRGPLAPRVEAGLRDLAPPLAACLDPDAAAATWHAFVAGRAGWIRPWSLFVLNEWTRLHL